MSELKKINELEFLTNNKNTKVSYLAHHYMKLGAAYVNNIQVGKEDGRREGYAEGRNEGLIIGSAQGRSQERIENILSLLLYGMKPDLVAKVLKLPLEQVSNVIDQIKKELVSRTF